jgi:hypothetical protein
MAITLNSFTAGQVIVAADMNTNFNNINSWSDTVALKAGAAFTGNVTITSGTFIVGANTAGDDVKFFGDTSGAYVEWDADTDDLILAGAARVVIPDGQLVLGSTAVTSTAAELNILDGVTSTAAELNLLDGSTVGTVVASKAVVASADLDIASFRNITLTGELDTNTIDVHGTAGASNLQITFAEGYKIYADNDGAGSDSSRLWFEAPDNGEIVLGPRTGGHELHQIRLRGTTVAVEGILTVSGAATVGGLITANGGLVIENGDTFTFNTVGLTSVIDSTETWASNDTSIATTSAINARFAAVHIASSAPNAGAAGELWIDTSS